MDINFTLPVTLTDMPPNSQLQKSAVHSFSKYAHSSSKLSINLLPVYLVIIFLFRLINDLKTRQFDESK